MKTLQKLTALILMICLLSVCFIGCGKQDDSDDLAYIRNKGSLIVGVTDFEPMDFQVDGKWTGFDAELAEAVGKKLGVTVVFQEISWEAKETELAGKTIDCIWNGLTWDEDRAANMSMTDYYMLNRQVVVVKAENASAYGSTDALSKRNVAAESGSAGEDLIKKQLPDATYIEKDAQIDVLTELLAGTVDAGVIDYTMAYYLINKEGSSFSGLKILENVVETEDEYYAVAFRKGSNVTAKVNEILSGFKKDGTIDALAAKYGQTDAIVK